MRQSLVAAVHVLYVTQRLYEYDVLVSYGADEAIDTRMSESTIRFSSCFKVGGLVDMEYLNQSNVAFSVWRRRCLSETSLVQLMCDFKKVVVFHQDDTTIPYLPAKKFI